MFIKLEVRVIIYRGEICRSVRSPQFRNKHWYTTRKLLYIIQTYLHSAAALVSKETLCGGRRVLHNDGLVGSGRRRDLLQLYRHDVSWHQLHKLYWLLHGH